MQDRYYLRSFGCQMNDHDAERIRALLEAEGLEQVDAPDAADVLVYNTCTVRKSADERLAGHLGTAARLKRSDPSRLVLVTGCLPQAEQSDLFTRFPFVDGALGPQNLHRLPELLRAAARRADQGPPGYFDDGPVLSGGLAGRRERPFQAWLQVMSGCTNYCTYCIVPYVRGPERSRPLAELVAAAEALVADGVREITLLGQNVNAYGLDLETDRAAPGARFAELLQHLDALPGLDRIRFMTSHPKDLGDDLVAAVSTLPSVCEHVHLPVQAGSDAVLRAMRRGYTAGQYLERVHALREAVPEVSITTDLIAGFPGETERDFERTLDLVRQAAFDGAFTFMYSARPGTQAAQLPDQVPLELRRERVERLIELTQQQALASHSAWVGRRVEVLVEGRSRDGALYRGRTRQNVTANLDGDADAGAIVTVEVTAATSTTLRGTTV
ncbi:MAG TPA: tRNA (N6-isopentenyl adenosine(37)-C2)-methylthiotransferase MiaB [Thermoleophilia bacterium]|nr:tRNA (N6-isopentenyl adenosine(37)-C2)-methylthiotransferase MiaB [Thermoleophilia bacterium]